MANGCSDSVHTSVADAYRSISLAVFGTSARDKMQLAEMSVSASISDIQEAQLKSKKELGTLVQRVRDMDPVKQRLQVQEVLGRSRLLRSSLAALSKKRSGMEQNLETLRQSQLNQNMLLSMKHTTDALQTMGLKVTDADSIMLDLEESTGDTNAMQTTLSSGFAENEWTQDDLDAEFDLIMSDDALCPCVPAKQKKPLNTATQDTDTQDTATQDTATQDTATQDTERTKAAEAGPPPDVINDDDDVPAAELAK